MTIQSNSNKVIAKNTILLYIRTVFTMLITLYTSRIILNTLGVEDYGVYSAVGGFVAMFGVISGALSNAISRNITYEIGKGDKKKVNIVFCTSVNIQIIISLIVFISCEFVGYWFLNNKMNVPENRLLAANWVLHCTLFSFVMSLLSVPYNAIIIAYEKMTAYAYISILEAVLKLGIVYILILSLYDKLILYSILLLLVSILIRLIYGKYCTMTFETAKYRIVFERRLFIDMISFAGWNFFSNAAYILNSQGVSLLMNTYFGVLMNSARGIATQVDGAVSQFVNNFTVAINPQITKSYAQNDASRLYLLICKGAKFSYFMLLFFAVPIIYETDYILELWLGIVPNHTSNFIRLAMLGALVSTLGNSGYTACMATGNIKRYSIWITSIACLVFVLTYIAYFLGAVAESTYIIYILVYIIIQIVRLCLMKYLINFPIGLFVKNVILYIFAPTVISLSLPSLFYNLMEASFYRLLLNTSIIMIITLISVYCLGLDSNERFIVKRKVQNYILCNNKNNRNTK